MSSPGQRRGVCGHAMAGFDLHAHCARCRDKLKGDNPCVSKKPCPHCDVLESAVICPCLSKEEGKT